MKFKYIIIASLILAILMVGVVSANDTVSQDTVSDNGDNTLETIEDDSYTETKSSGTFADLNNEIDNSDGELNINSNYKFNNETDNPNRGIIIDKDNFVINGNGHTFDADNQSRIFVVNGTNITIKNLTFINANSDQGSALCVYPGTSLTTDSLIFENNTAESSVVYVYGSEYHSVNDIFENNTAESSVVYVYGSEYYSDNDIFENNTVESVVYVYESKYHGVNDIFENDTTVTGVVDVVESEYYSVNDIFKDVTSSDSGVINVAKGSVYVENALMTSSKELSQGFIHSSDRSPAYSPITVLNSVFMNTVSNYTTAISARGNATVRNSKFINLTSHITAGAIGMKDTNELIVDNCTFVNVGSDKNGGAIFIDIIAENHPNTGEVLINRSSFVNCSSGFGGAMLQLGGFLNVENSNFVDDYALFDGGAIYTSNAGVNVVNSTFNNNYVLYDGEQRGSFGGAIFCDKGMLTLENSNLTQNSAQYGGAIYLYDSSYDIDQVTFKENTGLNGKYDDVYTVFDGNIAVLDNATITYSGNDSISLNTTNYATIVNCEGMKLSLINNTIDTSKLPSRFDLRELGWVTSVKNQGNMGSCWTFGSSGAMESAILRYLGLDVDLSENNMQDVSLMYYMYGIENMTEGGYTPVPSEYALSWLGVFDEEYDVYDQLGKISPIFADFNSIHIQDVIILNPRKNATDNDHLKEAILKYGGLYINYFATTNEVEQYYNGIPQINHGVTLIGWDDNREIAGAPGKGAWIIKNSWGESTGENGYQYISYYDTALSTITPSYGFILENTVEYNKNYQYDIVGSLDFYVNATEYRNNYVAVDDDLIAGVGTYLPDYGVEYNIEIYVNDDLKLTQDGVSPFPGFHTVKLDSYVPIKEGDVFTIKIKSNCVPVLKDSRQHYVKGASQYLYDDVWMNISTENNVCSIKAYTVADDSKIINNSDISVDYASGSFFRAKVVTADGHAVAGAPVGFTINGKTVNVTTDDECIAQFEIVEAPGIYIVTTNYNNQSYQNIVTVNEVPDDDEETDDESDVVTDNKSINTKTIPVNYKSQTANHVYTLYRASDMKMICHSNVINLNALIDLFEFNLTNGHLKVYIDGTLVFDGDVGDDLSKVIIEIIEKFLGKHEIVVEFTDNNGEVHTLNETIIIK